MMAVAYSLTYFSEAGAELAGTLGGWWVGRTGMGGWTGMEGQWVGRTGIGGRTGIAGRTGVGGWWVGRTEMGGKLAGGLSGVDR